MLAVEPKQYEPLHLKYRPKILSDLVGQPIVQQALTNALTDNRLTHAYLFTGSRGTGKTTSARILAKSINCHAYDGPSPSPCGQCESCRGIENGSAIDVIELDAASHNGVADARELIERAAYSPVNSRYKVFIIDECHMLTQQASNCLLKLIEEPPPRVIFVLATTDPQKLLDTIKSRCQIHRFRRVAEDDLLQHLEDLCRWEDLQATNDALRQIAIAAEGGVRSAETLLDKLALTQPIVASLVYEELGVLDPEAVADTLKNIYKKDIPALVKSTQALLATGIEPSNILVSFIRAYRDMLIATASPESNEPLIWLAHRWGAEKLLQGLNALSEAEYQLQKTNYSQLWLQCTLLRLAAC